MKDDKKKIFLITTGVIAIGYIVALVIKAKLKPKISSGQNTPQRLYNNGVDKNNSNIFSANSNSLPLNFKNWYNQNSYLLNSPRGIRNNNPGNLVKSNITWKGKLAEYLNKDEKFEMFISPEYGIRAMILDLKSDIKKGKNTVEKLISEYAPSHENKTNAYINKVSKDLNVSKNQKLQATKNTLKALVYSISRVENGGDFINDQLFEKAYLLT